MTVRLDERCLVSFYRYQSRKVWKFDVNYCFIRQITILIPESLRRDEEKGRGEESGRFLQVACVTIP